MPAITPIYLDFNATTPVDPDVLEAMMPYFNTAFGNAASATHQFGWAAAAAVEKAREQVALSIGAKPDEIVFTSGATESINLAMRGLCAAYATNGSEILVCSTEHKAVLDTGFSLQKNGIIVREIQVDREGRIDVNELENMFNAYTLMVCVMQANNETGVLQDVEQIGRLCRDRKVIFFSDLTQAVGKVRVDVKECCIDAACISAHKFYGPKGVGALYINRDKPRLSPVSQITGGGHEQGLRSGTLNVPGIVGMGLAAEKAVSLLFEEGARLSQLRNLFEHSLQYKLGIRINGSIRNRLPNTSNIYFPEITAGELMHRFPELAFSAGSACTSAVKASSHVLKAMGLTDKEAAGSIRISLGRSTTDTHIRYAISCFSAE